MEHKDFFLYSVRGLFHAAKIISFAAAPLAEKIAEFCGAVFSRSTTRAISWVSNLDDTCGAWGCG
jgi:hypothetical protein